MNYFAEKVLDLTFYKGTDEYSDGDVEDKILDIVKSNEDIDTVLENTDDFAIFYHLSKERENIVNIMNIKKNDNVLEIGSGCGALTGALAQRAGSVQAIDLSKRRSLINAYKNRNYDNIRIWVGNYEDIDIETKYDVITLIGVLEYAGYYIHSDNPYVDFLKDVSTKLKDGGRLYIAIENRLGAKYFAGCKEDHLLKEGKGLEGYGENSKVRTFSYYELIKLFNECNLNNYTFYYPYPDYKFSHVIFSDYFLPCRGELTEISSNYNSKRNMWFCETDFMNSLLMEQEFKIFSNSFLIELIK